MEAGRPCNKPLAYKLRPKCNCRPLPVVVVVVLEAERVKWSRLAGALGGVNDEKLLISLANLRWALFSSSERTFTVHPFVRRGEFNSKLCGARSCSVSDAKILVRGEEEDH